MPKEDLFVPINNFVPIPFQLIVVRYGDCTNNGRKSLKLNDNGKKSVNSLLDKISDNLIGNEEIVLLSSNAPRALASSLHIFHKLDGANVIFADNALRLDYQYSEDYDVAVNMIKTIGNYADIAIVITNRDYANTFPQFFVRKMSGGRKSCDILNIPRGGGVWIDRNLNAKMIT